MKKIYRFLGRDERGATAIEYGLIAALISVVLISALGAVGNNSRTGFNKISSAVSNANTQGR
jgi:pilus assembly protein Flp/PilA